MTNFQGILNLKQYKPNKSIKRGIKIWLLSDFSSGYTYDLNIYCGKEEGVKVGLVGEEVVIKLTENIVDEDVVLYFNRYFTSARLLNTMVHPVLGTIGMNRKDVPKLVVKLKERGNHVFESNNSGTLGVKWLDVKPVYMLSNCHKPDIGTVKITVHDGKKHKVPCPEMIKFYWYAMDGVDLSDKMAGVYDFNCKSTKWWKKVFYRLMMGAAVNSWIVFNKLQETKNSLLYFLLPLAKALIEKGKKTATAKRKQNERLQALNAKLSITSRPRTEHRSSRAPKRRQCASCSKAKKETRTYSLCKTCDKAYCLRCFEPEHMKFL